MPGLKFLLTNRDEAIQTDGPYPLTSFYQYGQTPIFTNPLTQRSIKFGQGSAYDRPDGSYSREPFMGKNIDLPGVEEKPSKALGLIDSLTNSLVRGGITTAISRAGKDTARITKFYLSSRGISWLGAQVGLQLTNPLIREGGTLTRPRNSNQRTYNLGINTLAQIPFTFTGLHLKREGLLPTDYQGYIGDLQETKYGKDGTNPGEGLGHLSPIDIYSSTGAVGGVGTDLVLTAPDGALGDGNRLINLFAQHIIPDAGSANASADTEDGKFKKFFKSAGAALSKFANAGNQLSTSELYSYKGGPNSLYGIGRTTHYKTSENTGKLAKEALNSNFLAYQGGGLLDNSDPNMSKLGAETGLQWRVPKSGIIPSAYMLTISEQKETIYYGTEYEEDEDWETSYDDDGLMIEEEEDEDIVITTRNQRGYYTPGAMWTHPLYSEPGINKYSELVTIGLKGGTPRLMQTGFKANAAAAFAPENKAKLLSRKPDSLDEHYFYHSEAKAIVLKADFSRKKRKIPVTAVEANSKLFNKPELANDAGTWKGADDDVTGHTKNSAATNYNATTTHGVKWYREERINLGNPGTNLVGKTGTNKKGEATSDYDIMYDDKGLLINTIDKINALDIFKSDTDSFGFKETRDLIQFHIQALDGDDPSLREVMVFRAYLSTFSDKYNGKWNNFQYNGRAEEFYTYGGFNRSINFGFKIAAQSRHEMMPLYRKLNYLLTQTAPDYSGTRMRGSFCKLTIGSLVMRTPGFFESVDIKWNKEYPWEITISEPEKGPDNDGIMQLPHVMDVNCSFRPIHNFIPQKSVTKSPFILPSNLHGGSLKKYQRWGDFDSAGVHGNYGGKKGTEGYNTYDNYTRALPKKTIERMKKELN